MEIEFSPLLLNDLLVGSAALVLALVGMLLVWGFVLRIVGRSLGKSKLYFLPEIFRTLTPSVALASFLLALYIATLLVQSEWLNQSVFKIWGILLIFVGVNILAKIVLGIVDVYYKRTRAKEMAQLYRSLPMLKSVVGIVLYSLAFVLSIQVLSSEVGTVILVLILILGLLFFGMYYSQIKSVAAGFQLTNYYIEEGDLIEIEGCKGFVEGIYARSTLLRTLDGKKLAIPNYLFFKRPLLLHKIEGNELGMTVQIAGTDPAPIKSRLLAISGKVALGLSEIPDEFKPRVFLAGIEKGACRFSMYVRLLPGADARKVFDGLSTALAQEFRQDLQLARLD